MVREYIWQLANQTQVFADWCGFADAALPGSRPAGLLRWCSRMVMASGLSDACWWLPYFALVLLLAVSAFLLLPREVRTGTKARWAAVASCLLISALYVVVPVVAMGSFVWDESECSFPVMNPLGTLVSLGLFAALRRVVGRRSWAILPAALLCALLFVPFGAYPIASLTALAVWMCACRFHWSAAVFAHCLLAIVLALAGVGVELRCVYDDLAPQIAFESSHAMRLRWNPCGPELARQLRMERAVVSRDWKAVLDAAGGFGDAIMRMETAYRILAQYRLGLLPDDLFRYPINSPHTLASEDQWIMDGYLLFFEYGLLQQARCYAMELAVKRGWRPDFHRVLGDVALIQGLSAEARRHYMQLARVPFRKALAEKRLRCMDSGQVPHELADVAQMATVLDLQAGADGRLEMFDLDNLVERHIYSRYANLGDAPDGMSKMHVAAMLLDCEIDRLVREHELLDRLYPGHWPVPVQEAVLLRASRLDPEVQAKYLKGVRPGVVQREVFELVGRFSEAREKVGASPSRDDAERLWREYKGTYMTYEWLVGR